MPSKHPTDLTLSLADTASAATRFSLTESNNCQSPQPQVTSGRSPTSSGSTSRSDITNDHSEEEDNMDNDSDEETSEQNATDSILQRAGARQSPSTSSHNSTTAIYPSFMESAQPTPLAPSTSSSTTTTSPIYLESQNLMDHVLAVAWIIIESYLGAYDQVYAPPLRALPSRPRSTSLIECLFREEPIVFLSLNALVENYELEFPDISTPPPPTPPSFRLTPPNWTEPSRRPNYMPPIHATPNAAPPSIALNPPAWRMEMQLRSALQQVGQVNQNNAMLPIPHPPPVVILHPTVPPNQIPVPLEEQFRRVPRPHRPLPRRARSADGQQAGSQTTAIGFVVQAAADVGSAIVSGMKRLRDGFDEGRSWKRMRIV